MKIYSNQIKEDNAFNTFVISFKLLKINLVKRNFRYTRIYLMILTYTK